MATIMDFLASILNPNPGQNRLVNPNSGGPNYLQQTGLAPDQLARFHQMSGLGDQAASPAVAPVQAAPMADQQQTASVAAPQASDGGFLSRIFGGGQGDGENQTIQWLQQQGMDPGTAAMLAKSKPALQDYLLKRSQGQKPIEVNGRLVDPNDYHVIADFSTPPAPQAPHTTTINGKLVSTDTGNVIGDYSTPDVKTRTMTPEEVKAAGLAPGVWQIDKDNKISKAGDAAPVQGGKFRFDGSSIEGQALNGLMDSGALSEDQAQQLAAGKTVTNPADGSLIFLTPRGIFSQPATGGVATPVQSPNAQPPPAAAPYVPPASPSNVPPPVSGPAQVAPAGVSPPAPVNPGLIPITGAKPSGKKTESEERYTAISTILLNEVPTLGANFKAMSDPSGQLLSKIPGGLGNMWQSEEYQRAASSVKTSISSILYALSGASSNPGEVINQISALTPEFGDKPGLVADKLQRFKVYVRSVATGSGDPKLKTMVEEAIGKMDTPAAPAADGWREITPGVKIRRVN